jgi:hypothetical protein
MVEIQTWTPLKKIQCDNNPSPPPNVFSPNSIMCFLMFNDEYKF